MPTISLCMIVRNEEETIARCLESVRELVDEIVIVDTGSTDQTLAVVQQYTDKIYVFPWRNDFAAARNFSFSKATKDYILWLDADDVLLPEDQRRFRHLQEHFPADVDAFLMDYHVNFDSEGRPAFSTVRTRLVRRAKQLQWQGRVHETLDDAGSSRAYVTIAVTHKKAKARTERNLSIYEQMLREGDAFSARDMFHYAWECVHHNRIEPARYWFEQYLEAEVQDDEFRTLACAHLADCYYRLGDVQKCLQSCLRALEHREPRPEITGRLSNLFIEMKRYKTALFWANLSLQLTPSPAQSADHMYATWLPHLQLSSCYMHLGDLAAAQLHLEKALAYAPHEPAVLAQREMIEQALLSEKTC